MEVETKDYASKGVAGTGLGLGIAGTALGLLNGGGLAALGLGNGVPQRAAPQNAENDAINRYEAARPPSMAALRGNTTTSEVKL